ncbi:MAG: DUF3299 domain-containing protein [Pseudomonadota bacterium]
MRKPFLCLALALFGVAACDAPQEQGAALAAVAQAAASAEPPAASEKPSAKTPAPPPGKPVEITWEQLMPEGEEDRLTELYTSYYEAVEAQLAEGLDAAGSGEGGSGDVDSADIVATIVEGSAADTMTQIGTFNVVEEFNGKAVRLPGYIVPFDFSAKAAYSEFLLVPYFGACLHTPPPPPNQIVFVKADPAVTILDIYEPVWVEGVLTTGQFNSDLADSAYELALDNVEIYEY